MGIVHPTHRPVKPDVLQPERTAAPRPRPPGVYVITTTRSYVMPQSTKTNDQATSVEGAFAALPFTILLTSGVAFLLASSTGALPLFTLLALLVGQAFALAASGVGERRGPAKVAPAGPAAEFGGVPEEAVREALQQAQDQVDDTEADRYVVVGAMGRLTVRQELPTIPGTAFILVRQDGGVLLGEVAGGDLGSALRRHEEGALLAGAEEE